MPTQTDTQKQAAFGAAGLNSSQQTGVLSGQGYKPSPITSATLTPQTPIQLPNPPADTNNYAGIVASGNAILKSLGDMQAKQSAGTATPQPTDLSSLLEQYLGGSPTPPSATDTYNTDYSTSGITALQSDANTKAAAVKTAQSNLTSVNAQLAGINAEAQAIPIQNQKDAEGRGITAAGLDPITTGQLRNNALKALPLQAQAIAAQAQVASAQGDQTLSDNLLTQAQDHLDKVFQLQMTDSTNQYNYQKDLRDKVYQFSTTQEQNRLDALQKAADQQHQDQQDALKNAQSLAKTAIDNGQADLAAKIAALDPTSPTYQQDLSVLEGQMKQNPQDVAYKNAQIAALNASTRKTNFEANALAPQSPNDPTAIPSDPNSQSILSQTGLSVAAFNYLTQGTASLSRLSATDRKKIMTEASTFLNNKGLDYSTFQSQYKAYNNVVQTNIQRFANTQVAEGEVSGSLDNLDTSGINGNVNWGNVAKVWAGQQVNDEKATNYAAQLSELRTSMAYFYAAQQGKTSADIPDFTLAEKTIKDGIANGGVTGLRTFIDSTTKKMTSVANKAVDVANQAIWNQFGVGNKYKSKTLPANSGTAGATIVTAPDGTQVQITD
jgi:hypothetical protein